MIRYKIFFSLLLICLLSSCAVFEFFGGAPTAKSSMQVSSELSVLQVFGCVKETVGKFHSKNAFWGDTVDFEDIDAGILKMGGYSNSGKMGFRLKTELDDENNLELILRGVGIMYSDLGVSEGMDKLKTGISTCIGV